MSDKKVSWTRVLKNIGYISVIIIITIIVVKLAIFYMPFVIAFVISIMIEPLIKKIMKKMKFSRKLSSIIVFIIVFGIILGLLIWGITTIISEATNLLSGFNNYYEKISNQLNYMIENLKFDSVNTSGELKDILGNTSTSLLEKVSKYLQGFLNNLVKFFTSIPSMTIYFIVTILALYFICTDKIYMIDELEHHLPDNWVKGLSRHTKEITKSMGGYLKAELKLIGISFVISLIGLYIMHFLGLNVGFPLLIALGIGFVDALPILGSGTVMVPWAFISALNGDFKLGISILTLWIIMSVTRQCLEPKLVSRKHRNSSNFYNNCNVYRVQNYGCFRHVCWTYYFNYIKKCF